MNVPFSACVGPDIEKMIYAGQTAEATRFFRQAVRALSKQSKIILYIPQHLFDCAIQDSHIKAFRQELALMSQAKVAISRNVSRSCAWTTNAPATYSTTAFMQGQVQRREMPFTIGLQNTDITKDACGPCPQNGPCRAAMSFCSKHPDPAFVADLEATKSAFVKTIAEQALAAFYQDFTLNATTRTLLARLLFIREGLDCARLHDNDQVYASSAFFEDANKATAKDKQDIVLSAARTFCYPPVRDTANREEGSLDWHEDVQALPGKVDLFRADVVPGLQTGRQRSGAKRLLFGRRRLDNRLLLFGYTPKHDFDKEKIRTRWKNAEEELKKL